jgi:hypothetical protein
MKGNKRRLLSITGVVAVVVMLVCLVPPVALASGGEEELDYIDIGDPASEAWHRLRGWGPIEPETSGGGWGGIDDCRVTWEPGTPDRMWHRSASFILKVPYGYRATTLILQVLDGLADDSFVVFVNWRKVYSYEGQQTGTEDWVIHTIPLNKCFCYRYVRVTIMAIGPAWSGFDTYGQLAVDEVTLLGKRYQCHRR